MRQCDIAVVGLGLAGSAALYALARAGADVIGFDPIGVGEPRGSSHGSCRVFRRFNFENLAYTALGGQAFAGWKRLEAESGRTILIPCPVLEAGPAGSALVRASRTASGATGGPRTGADANAAFPAFSLPDDWDAVVQESGGVLLAEAAMGAFRDAAADRVVSCAAQLAPTVSGIRVFAVDDEVLAQRVIVAAGPWIGRLIPDLTPLLAITRQTVGWFQPVAADLTALGEFPIFLLEGPHGLVYGFPDFEGRGVKAARHDHGPRAQPDDWSEPASNAELAPVAATLSELVPGAAGQILDRDVCLYTNTIAADVRPDGGEEFIIDRLPRDPRIIVASPCSGHGAKFASAIGEILARLALDPEFEADAAFRLDRFSAFAAR